MPESPADKAALADATTRLPLNGITVLDLTLARAGPTAVRHFADWGANVISHLARYTCDAVLQPGETMDIGSAVPPKSTISAFFFDDFKRMKYDGKDAGILLCIGLTSDEVKACRRGQRQQVYDALVAQKVFPYTNLFRQSVLKPTSGGFWRRLTGGA